MESFAGCWLGLSDNPSANGELYKTHGKKTQNSGVLSLQKGVIWGKLN